MRKALLAFVVMISAVLFATGVFAAPWQVPYNVRIVQKSDFNNIRTFGSIQSAIDSITTASATNPFVVKVMPGVYDLGTASVQMKEYVDLVGSGPENTIITSSNFNTLTTRCVVGTVIMASNSSISNLKVVNMPPAGAHVAAAIVFNDVQAKAEGVNVLVGDDIVLSSQNHGVCLDGQVDVTLNNINVEAHGNGIARAVRVEGGSGNLTLKNSKLSAIGRSLSVLNTAGGTQRVTVINCIIEGTGGETSSGLLMINSGASDFSISNSIIIANHIDPASGGSNTWTGSNKFTMVNSQIISNVRHGFGGGGTRRISNSLLPVDISTLAGAKLVNNYDANFDPIPNQ